MLTDSIGKRVKITTGEVASFPGDNICRLGDRIARGEVRVSDRCKILIHVGINDINDIFKYDKVKTTTVVQILDRYKSLRDLIRWRNSHAILLFSAILPRDSRCFSQYSPFIYGINFALEKLCAQSSGSCVFVDTWKFFMNGVSPRDELFAKRDGLHLCGFGDERLQHCWRQALSDTYIAEKRFSRRVARLANITY